MAPLTADPRLELVLRVLDTVPVRPAQHDLEQAAKEILHQLDDLRVHDCRCQITFDDETET